MEARAASNARIEDGLPAMRTKQTKTYSAKPDEVESRWLLTGNKAETTMRYHHSGYPGGIKSETYGALLRRDPIRALKQAVRGMLPAGVLGRSMLRKLKVHVGSEHPHQAQGPVPYEPPHARVI